MIELSVIIVSFNGWHVLRPCLRSVFEQTVGLDFEVMVVDNASTDGTSDRLVNEFPQVKVVRNNENLGFAAANNRGISKARGRYVLLLNPDTIILEGAIQKTLRFMEEHPKAGITGCRLLFPDRSLQRTARSFPTVLNVLWESTFLCFVFPKSKVFGRYYLTYFDHDQDLKVDWLMGAYLMIRRGVIDKIGLLDEQFYMYTEEVDFCFRTKQAGFDVWFTPNGEVLHFWGGMNATSRRVVLWTSASQILFFQKHFSGLRKYLAILIRYVGILVRVPVYLIAGGLRFDRRMLAKSYYFAFSAIKLLTTRWNYVHGFAGKVTPWVRY